MKPDSYKSLAWTVGIHFFIMYALTYVSVDVASDISLFSTRSLYMAVVMVAPMVILMMVFMRHMFQNERLNIILYAVSTLLFVTSFIFIRQQVFVGNGQFLRSMIPHHSGAITMCEESAITDQEILELCDTIVDTQKEEIAQMKAILNRLNN